MNKLVLVMMLLLTGCIKEYDIPTRIEGLWEYENRRNQIYLEYLDQNNAEGWLSRDYLAFNLPVIHNGDTIHADGVWKMDTFKCVANRDGNQYDIDYEFFGDILSFSFEVMEFRVNQAWIKPEKGDEYKLFKK